MGGRRIGSALLTCFICTAIALADEGKSATEQGEPAQSYPMTAAAKSELDTCVTQAGESAADEQQRKAMFGVFIDSKGRAISLAVLQSSGLEQLDKLVLRCLFKAHYIPAERGEPPTQWVYTAFFAPRPRDAGRAA